MGNPVLLIGFLFLFIASDLFAGNCRRALGDWRRSSEVENSTTLELANDRLADQMLELRGQRQRANSSSQLSRNQLRALIAQLDELSDENVIVPQAAGAAIHAIRLRVQNDAHRLWTPEDVENEMEAQFRDLPVVRDNMDPDELMFFYATISTSRSDQTNYLLQNYMMRFQNSRTQLSRPYVVTSELRRILNEIYSHNQNIVRQEEAARRINDEMNLISRNMSANTERARRM